MSLPRLLMFALRRAGDVTPAPLGREWTQEDHERGQRRFWLEFNILRGAERAREVEASLVQTQLDRELFGKPRPVPRFNDIRGDWRIHLGTRSRWPTEAVIREATLEHASRLENEDPSRALSPRMLELLNEGEHEADLKRSLDWEWRESRD